MNRDITANGRAVRFGVALQRGEITAYHTQTPATLLEEEESGGAVNPDTARSLLLRTVMAYLFAHGPHPALVINRLYVLTREVAPQLLRALPAAELCWLLADLDEAHDWRLRACLRGTRVSRRAARRHEVVVQATLSDAHHRHVREDLAVTVEMDDVLNLAEHEMVTDYVSRMRLLAAGLEFFFYEGPQPERTVVRVYALAKAQFPALILHMNVRQLGALFGVTGAAWSERIKRKFNHFLDSRGAFGVRAPFQKSASACASFARAQRGNHNRRNGRRRAVI